MLGGITASPSRTMTNSVCQCFFAWNTSFPVTKLGMDTTLLVRRTGPVAPTQSFSISADPSTHISFHITRREQDLTGHHIIMRIERNGLAWRCTVTGYEGDVRLSKECLSNLRRLRIGEPMQNHPTSSSFDWAIVPTPTSLGLLTLLSPFSSGTNEPSFPLFWAFASTPFDDARTPYYRSDRPCRQAETPIVIGPSAPTGRVSVR